MRRYETLKSCELFAGTHQHLITDDNAYCQAVGKWLKDSTGKSYKDLKQAWKEREAKKDE